jgi:tRNA U54 and U55 pseudouridine synthase Pus10
MMSSHLRPKLGSFKREDMDVRMILPRDALDAEKASLVGSDQTIKKSGTSSGRPFVLEVIDAYQMPNREGLDKAHCAINHVANAEETVALGITPGSSIWVEEKERTHVQYGVNPKGVGISGLDFCPASCFSNLQSETEDKVKFYGCLCWSHQRIPNQGYLDSLLNNSMCPLEISQSTPLRVLHRRSKAVRVRHVLSLKPHRIDDHWFRLEMSTTAGTYVKEFCHGDLRRTSPSVSSLLGCKVDIVELDCHGIATK